MIRIYQCWSFEASGPGDLDESEIGSIRAYETGTADVVSEEDVESVAAAVGARQ